MMNEIMNNEIWIFGDLRNERLFRFSLNVLAKAVALARFEGRKVVMVFLDAPEDASQSPNHAGAVSLEIA